MIEGKWNSLYAGCALHSIATENTKSSS